MKIFLMQLDTYINVCRETDTKYIKKIKASLSKYKIKSM